MSLFANLKYGIGLAGWRPGESKKLESATLPTWGKQETRSVYDTSFGTPVTIVPKPKQATTSGSREEVFSKEIRDFLGTLSEEDRNAFVEFVSIADSIPPVELISELVHYKDERERKGNPLKLTETMEPVNEIDSVLFGIYFIKMKNGKKIVESAQEEIIPIEIPAEASANDDDGDTMTLAQALDEQEEKKKRRSSSKKKTPNPKEDVDPAEAESPQE